MKKYLSLLLALAMILSLCACGTQTPVAEEPTPTAEAPTEPVEEVNLVVFAAASMTAALDQIKTLYEAGNPGVTLTLTLDSSGTLKTQIEEGADCDVFISASQKSMNQLDITASAEVNTDGLDFVVEGSRVNIVSNFCVLAVPEGNPAGIESFLDVATDACSLIALGNSDVPAGQYAQQIFEYLGIWDEIQGKITFCSNVKEVTTQVSEQAVDCGIVYGTDAMDAGLSWVDVAEEGMHDAVVYPAAVMKSTQNEQAALDFVSYLTSAEAQDVFTSLGFSIP